MTEAMATGSRPIGRTAVEEAELIARIVGGEPDQFHELIRPYERGLYVTAFSILRNEEDAEDAVQEAVLKVFRALKSFRGDAKFSTWMVAILLNEARSRLRKAKQATEDSLTEDDEEMGGDYTPAVLADWRYVPSEALERKELCKLLVDAITALAPDYREVFTLRDVREMSTAETAAALNINEGLVKIRLFRARLMLQKVLAPQLAPKQRGLLGWLARKSGVACL